jgi:hypothetical protein
MAWLGVKMPVMRVLINAANSLPFFLQSSASNQEEIPLIR